MSDREPIPTRGRHYAVRTRETAQDYAALPANTAERSYAMGGTVSRRKLLKGFGLVLLAVIVGACGGPLGSASSSSSTPSGVPAGGSDGTPDSITGTGDYVAVAANRVLPISAQDAAHAASLVNQLGFDLYGRSGDGNTVVSPTSIALALAMARPGAAGNTAAEMDAVMHGLAAPADLVAVASLNHSLASLSGTFKNPTTGESQSVALRTANAAYAQAGMPLRTAYVTTLANVFGAGIRLADFAKDPEAARNSINAWIATQTEKRIIDLIGPGQMDEYTRLTLVNAIYLKAPWANQFETEATNQAEFKTRSGMTVVAPMMRQTSEFPYAAGAGWQAVELGYTGGSLAMTIILPSDIAGFEKTLDAKTFDSIVSALQPRNVAFSMPRFKLDARTELSKQLQSLGMKDAFVPDRADFGGITGAGRLSIQAVVHQANIDVDETGTEAAAATAVIARVTSLPADAATLTLDRPFIFALRDRTTGAILFLGRVDDPTAK